MRLPIRVTDQKRCPVCKKAGMATPEPSPDPYPERVTISACRLIDGDDISDSRVMSAVLELGWDAGLGVGPTARVGIGAAMFLAKRDGACEDGSTIDLRFCSVACARRFFDEAFDDLERQVEALRPRAEQARARHAAGVEGAKLKAKPRARPKKRRPGA